MKNITKDMETIKVKAKILKALSHPIRLCIVKGLTIEEGCNVSNMQECLRIPQSTLSQHLTKLRDVGILKSEQQGVERKYYICNDDAREIIKTLF